MIQAKEGDVVRVDYTGTLADGTIFDSTIERGPFEFTLGSKQVIEGFNDGILGMAVGDHKTLHIPIGEAYGPFREEDVLVVDRAEFPDELHLEVGITINMHEDGNPQVIPVIVRAITDDSVTLDANHPLAGHDLTFDIELVEIK
jgi:peptidylprolyl isomerase